ncbi:hypothetical protein, partial [Streptomyces lasiicapitis]|uniref:hypothetical protein n=1 Tax=Streptomyces lasiicapitis TaxID=1923961 RepID=UPI0036465987
MLLCLALLFGAFAGVLALAGKAEAQAFTPVGKFTLQPASGSVKDLPLAASAATDGGCKDVAAPSATPLWVVDPAKPDSATMIGRSAPGSQSSVTDPFTVPLAPAASGITLEGALREFVPQGSLDGTYTLMLACKGGTDAPAFAAAVKVTGDTWNQLQAQPTTIAKSEPMSAVVNSSYKVKAAVTPNGAAGSVAFEGATAAGGPWTPLGPAAGADGQAERAGTAPAPPREQLLRRT